MLSRFFTALLFSAMSDSQHYCARSAKKGDWLRGAICFTTREIVAATMPVPLFFA
jgi:hypothetical protein